MRFLLGVLAGLICGYLLARSQPSERGGRVPVAPRAAVAVAVVPRAPPLPPGSRDATQRIREIDHYRRLMDGDSRGVGWLSIVARFGGASDIAWIESRAEGDPKRERELDRALAEGAANPLAAARFAERMQDPERHLPRLCVRAFARENPDAAFEAAVRSLPTATRNRAAIVELIGRSATDRTLEIALSVLAPLGTDALRAVDLMFRRGLDVARFEAIIRAPLQRVDGYRYGDDIRPVLQALSALRRHRVTWSGEAHEAARMLAGRAQPEVARQAAATASYMRR